MPQESEVAILSIFFLLMLTLDDVMTRGDYFIFDFFDYAFAARLCLIFQRKARIYHDDARF